MYPFSLWILMIVAVIGYSVGSDINTVKINSYHSYTRRIPNPLLYWLTTLVIGWFAGNILANDVELYRANFLSLSTEFRIEDFWGEGLGDNPGFNTIQWWVRTHFSSDPSTFQLIWVGIAQILFMQTYKRYSVSMPLTIMMYIASGLLYFTAVSWKQSMAMAIGFAATPLVFKRKWIIYYSILITTMAIHPYIIMFGILPLFISRKVWTRKSIIILGALLVIGRLLSSVLGTALEVTEGIFGDQYSSEWFGAEYGVRPERVIFYAICPVLAVLYRKRLDEYSNPMMNAMIQMSVISFGFMAMAIGGGANFISRMGNYFEPFTYIALPYILLKITPKSSRVLMLWGTIIIYLVYFTFLQLKHGSLW